MRTIVKILFVLGVGAPATAHAVSTTRAKEEAKREMAALTAAIALGVVPPTPPMALEGDGLRRVTLNGATIAFSKTTARGTLDEVMGGVARECESGDASVALGEETTGERRSRAIDLERIVTQNAENGARASLCIFAAEPGEGERLRRVRYTLAHTREDGSVSVTTVIHASSTPLAELFPREGDAPGSDLSEVARPEASRRTLTAIVGKTGSVRVYESTLAVNDAVARYDAAMAQRGFEATASLADARMYRREGKSYAVSFRATTAGSTVAIAPFDAPSH